MRGKLTAGGSSRSGSTAGGAAAGSAAGFAARLSASVSRQVLVRSMRPLLWGAATMDSKLDPFPSRMGSLQTRSSPPIKSHHEGIA